jgi:hypothetical protein
LGFLDEYGMFFVCFAHFDKIYLRCLREYMQKIYFRVLVAEISCRRTFDTSEKHKKSATQTAITTAALHARGSSLDPAVMNLLMCNLVKGNLGCDAELGLHSPHKQGNAFVIKGGSSSAHWQFTAADTVSLGH